MFMHIILQNNHILLCMFMYVCMGVHICVCVCYMPDKKRTALYMDYIGIYVLIYSQETTCQTQTHPSYMLCYYSGRLSRIKKNFQQKRQKEKTNKQTKETFWKIAKT